MNEEEIAYKVIGQAIVVHKLLGPGLLENAYKESLYYKLKQIGLHVEKEKSMPLVLEDVKLDVGYRIDLLVNKKLVIELKSVEALNDVHMAQVLTHLKLGGFKLGLLFNFNVKSLPQGMRRIKNGYHGLDFKKERHEV